MLTINLNYKDKLPLYEQIYNEIKTLITRGELEKDYRLPSEREFAANLQVSRSTVSNAYKQLDSEGYIEVKAKSGYYVNEVVGVDKITEKSFSKYVKKEPVPVYKYDFSPLSLCKESFPYKIWARLHKKCLEEEGENLFNLGESQGDIELRLAISNYLKAYRGIVAKYENIIIGAGTSYLLQLLEHIIPSNFNFAMENPTYLKSYKILASLERKVIPIELDKSGLRADKLAESGANIVYLTPSHQFPLGIVMPIRRRREILKWAETSKKYIIEDDHDSEFRYRGLPIPPMKSIDNYDRVIYLGTFSRTISPAIRIGYMILPDDLLVQYKKKFGFLSSTVPRIEQAVLRKFIKEGYFERHINRARKIYKMRHDAIIKALKVFKDDITITGESAGMNIAVTFKYDLPFAKLKELAENSSIKIISLSDYCIGEITKRKYLSTLVMGYGALNKKEIEEGITALSEKIKALRK